MKYIFLDTEMTSLDRTKRRIWDMAYILREPGEPDVEKQFFLNVSLEDADPISLDIGRYYERHPDPYHYEGRFGHITDYQFGKLIEAVEDMRGATIVGAVPSFDEETFARFIHQAFGLQPTWRYHLVDIETLLAGHFGMEPPWNYERIIAATGLPPIPDDQQHTALGDARMVRDLWDWWTRQNRTKEEDPR